MIVAALLSSAVNVDVKGDLIKGKQKNRPPVFYREEINKIQISGDQKPKHRNVDIKHLADTWHGMA